MLGGFYLAQRPSGHRITPDQALALSLIKRAADLVVGVPGLVSLQILESGRLKARYSQAKESRAAIVPSQSPSS